MVSIVKEPFLKDVLLKRMEQEYIRCGKNLVINGRF